MTTKELKLFADDLATILNLAAQMGLAVTAENKHGALELRLQATDDESENFFAAIASLRDAEARRNAELKRLRREMREVRGRDYSAKPEAKIAVMPGTKPTLVASQSGKPERVQ